MSFPRYPAYKPSGVEWLGEVPEHWDVTPLKRLATIQTGLAKGKEVEPEHCVEVPFLRVANVQDGFLDLEQIHTILIPEPSLDRYLLRHGDVLMNEGGDFDKLGRGAIWNGEIELCIHQNHVFAVRPHSVRPSWLNAYTSSKQANSYFISRSKQSTNLASISSSNLMELLVPLVPDDETTQILDFLDRETAKIDALIAEQQRLIELLQEKRQAVISHAVTMGLNPDAPMKDSGVEWLGEVPEHWEVKQLKFLLKDLSQGCSPNCLQDPAENGQYGVLKVGCVNEIEFRSGENKALPDAEIPSFENLIRAGDILMSRGNTPELVGLSVVVPEKTTNLLASDLIFILRVNRESVSPRFLSLLIRSSSGRHQIESQCVGTSSSMQKINQGTIKSLLFALPPLEEQQLIASVIHRQITVNVELSMDASNAIQLLQERRSALISAAVTGQIDVRGLVPEASAA